MNRSEALSAAGTALGGVDDFSLVLIGPRRRYTASPAIILAGASTYPDTDLRTRDSDELGHEIAAMLLIQSDEDQEAAVEAQMGDLVETTITTLEAVGFIFVRSDAAAGVFLPVIDGIAYRTERLIFRADATE